MKLNVIYKDKTGIVGNKWFDIATYSENEMLEYGRKLKATTAYIGNNTIRGIKYDDKHSDKRTEKRLECEGKENIGNVSNNIINEL